MPILTVADACRLVPSLEGQDGGKIQAILDGVQTTVERYCNRTFDLARSVTKYYDLPPPGGRNEITLNVRPINSITSVKVDANGGYGQLADTFGTTTLLTAGEDYYYEPGTDILRVLTSRLSWPAWGTFGGYGTFGYPFGVNGRNARTGCVQVVMNAGYSEIPADLKLAAGQILSWLYGDSGAMNSGGRGVTSYMDVSVGAGMAVDALAGGNVPALGTARQILNSYREIAVAGQGRW